MFLLNIIRLRIKIKYIILNLFFENIYFREWINKFIVKYKKYIQY